MGLRHAVPAPVRLALHQRRGPHRLHRPGSAHLPGRPSSVRRPDGLPDDLCLHRQRAHVRHRGHRPQVRPAAAADLPDARALPGQQDLRGLPGRARHRHPGRRLHRHRLLLHLPEGPGEAGAACEIGLFGKRASTPGRLITRVEMCVD